MKPRCKYIAIYTNTFTSSYHQPLKKQKNKQMKLPSDYKRNYRFRTDTSKEKKYINIMLIVCLVLVILWYVYKYFFV